MFLSRNKKTNVYPRKPQFYYIKVGFKGVNIIQACFHDVLWVLIRRADVLLMSTSNEYPQHTLSYQNKKDINLDTPLIWKYEF